ncbi:MAG: hypothetical protein IPN66_16895 [Candidatus Competibacteraceae bacterium]|nr:hypothetical protein [Candidatus Competibacteraceae bacterium]
MSDDYLRISVDGHLSDSQKSALSGNGVAISTSNSLFGGEVATEIIAVLSAPYVLSHLKDVIIELIKNRRKVRVKTKDFEFNDMSEAQILVLIERLSSNNSDPSPASASPPKAAKTRKRPKGGA